MKDFDHFAQLLRWASGGALSASLVFIVFVPTLVHVDSYLQSFSMACFVAAIPFLSMSLARYKEYEIKKSKEEERSDAHISSAVAGFLFAFSGFGLLLAAIDIIYLFIFISSLFFMMLMERLESRAKKKS